MNEENAPSRYRGPDLLRLLMTYGQLSIPTLEKMVEPHMSRKKLARALCRLLARGLVERKKSERTYFYICQSPPSRKACADILGCSPDDLIQPLLKRKDWHHQELCEYWIFLLKKAFPLAEVVRDRQILSHEKASEIMLADRDGYDLFPDFLLIFPKEDGKETVGIAVEIERTRKSNERLIRKLKSYTTQTRIAGLLYVCDSGRLSDTIRLLYESKVEQGTNRCGHYGEFYFLFSDAIETADEPLDRIFSARGRKVRLDEWIIPLLTTPWTLRRSEMFTRGGEPTPSIST